MGGANSVAPGTVFLDDRDGRPRAAFRGPSLHPGELELVGAMAGDEVGG